MGGSNSTGRGKGASPPAMTPVEEVDISAVRYKSPTLQAPHLTGFSLRAFLWLMESSLLGPLITSVLKSQNNMPQMLQQTLIPERPMYYPEYPPQDPEPGVVLVEEDRHPVERVHEALQYLPQYDPSLRWTTEEKPPFLYWKIRDFAHAYRSGITTPSIMISGSKLRIPQRDLSKKK
nr:unnamed protein product [Digitaria exilis]